MLNTDPIVIVEDDPDDHYFLQRACEKLKIQNKLIFFHNGIEALNYLTATEERTFIILSDINMPMMNGLELKRRINENPTLRNKSIPFIFFTTSARYAEIKSAFDLNAQGFFIKEDNASDTEATLKCIFEYWDKARSPQ
jgi:CheY-like chemotaxis protein